jgi:hypothetical protein
LNKLVELEKRFTVNVKFTMNQRDDQAQHLWMDYNSTDEIPMVCIITRNIDLESFQKRKTFWMKTSEESWRNKNVETTPAERILIQNLENDAALF